MGSQATVLIRTDALSEIEHNAQEFVNNMLLAIHAVAAGAAAKDFAAGCHANPAMVINYHHNDTTSVAVMGGGYGQEIVQIYNHGRWNDKREIAVTAVRELISKYRIKAQEVGH
jgi:hypothetical protein